MTVIFYNLYENNSLSLATMDSDKNLHGHGMAWPSGDLDQNLLDDEGWWKQSFPVFSWFMIFI